MLNRILLGIAIAATTFFSRDICAQIAISTAGGDAFSSSGSFSYTVGQTAYTYFQNDDFDLGLGVQQAYSVELLFADRKTLQSTIEIFPNPASDELNINLGNAHEAIEIRIFTASGQLIFLGGFSGDRANIAFDAFSPGVYLLHVLTEHEPAKVFKIVKP
jgi:hypothetical protein